MKSSLIPRATAIPIAFGFALLISACSRDQAGPASPVVVQGTVQSLEAADEVYGRVDPDDGLEPIRLTGTTHTVYFTVRNTSLGGMGYRLDVDPAGTTGVSDVSVVAADQCGILAAGASKQVGVTYGALVPGMGRLNVLGRFGGGVGLDSCPIYPGWSVDAGSVRVPIQDGPLTLTISGPTNMGHYDTCSWTANRTGGVPPYSSYWWQHWEESPSAEFFFNSNAAATVSGWGYNYGNEYATIHLSASVSDAAGQGVLAFEDVALYQYALGCY